VTGSRRPLAGALAMVVPLHIAINGIRPMTSYMALGLGATVEQLGLLSIGFAGLALLTAIPLGRAIDRWGARPFTVAAPALVAAAALGLVLTDSLVVVILLQSAIGLGLVAAAIGYQTLVAAAGPLESADRRFGSLTAVVALSQLAGPAVAGVIAETAAAAGATPADDPHGVTWVFAVMCGLATASAIVAFTLPDPGAPARPGARSGIGADTVQVLRTPGIAGALVVSVVVFGVTDLLVLYLPVFGTQAGWSVGFVAALLATRAGASVAIRLVFGRLIERLGRRVLLAAGCVLGILSAVALPLAGDTVGPFVCLAIFGAAVGMGQPISMAWVARFAPAHLRSTSLGVRLTVNQVWLIAVPPVVGVIIGLAGPAWLFFSIAGLLAATLPPIARGPR